MMPNQPPSHRPASRAMPIALCALLLCSSAALAQSTRPATVPASADPDTMLKHLLAPARPAVQPLQPLPDGPRIDQSSRTAVSPRAESLALIREGTIIPNKAGRLTRTPEGQAEFVFEADGQAMQDPPMLILPNLELMSMEHAAKNSSRELRFRVTGMVTEYGGRNYILLQKVVVAAAP